MKAVTQDIRDITDSRELLESKPHPIISAFVYILIGLVAAALVWTWFGQIDEYVKAGGIVRPSTGVSTITNAVAGNVESVLFYEGMQVKQGDILYTIDHAALDLIQDNLTQQLEQTNQELANLATLENSITDSKNYFDPTLDSEKEYYNQYLKEELAEQYAEAQITITETTLADLQLLQQSITESKNLFDVANTVYYNKYADYLFNVTKLNIAFEQSQEAYKNAVALYQVGGISYYELTQAKAQQDAAEAELNNYINLYAMDLSNSITQNTQNLNNLDINMQQDRINTLVQIEDSLTTMQQSRDTIEKDLKTTTLNIEQSIVKAPLAGIVHLITEINEGDLLQSGTEIATIVPANNEQYKIQLYVSNKDIASIKEDQTIKYQFDSLPFREYGELTGKITVIGTDATVDQQSGMSFYAVEATVDVKPLYSYQGVPAKIKVGMTCQAHVIMKSERILLYILEKN